MVRVNTDLEIDCDKVQRVHLIYSTIYFVCVRRSLAVTIFYLRHFISNNGSRVFIQLMMDVCLYWCWKSMMILSLCTRQEAEGRRREAGWNLSHLVIFTPQKAGVNTHAHFLCPKSPPHHLYRTSKVFARLCVCACTKALCIFNVCPSEPLVS